MTWGQVSESQFSQIRTIAAYKMRLISDDPAFTKHKDEDGLTFFTGEKLNWSGTISSGQAKIYVCDSEDAVVQVLGKHVGDIERNLQNGASISISD